MARKKTKKRKRKIAKSELVTVDPAFVEAAKQLCVDFLLGCTAAEVRSLRQFAREEIILPDDGGPFAGEPFDPDCQPYVDILFEELEHGGWSEVFITGPNQSGKTLCAFVILIVYTAAELRKNVIVGVPTIEMANDKWDIDIKPVFMASPNLRVLLPKSGPGSEGSKGKVKDSVTLANGVKIKFLSTGGSDASKAGFTGGKAIVTEAPAWSRKVTTSHEASPLDQVRARQFSVPQFLDDGSVNPERQLIVEGTLTVDSELPWTAKENSSDSVLVCPCVHCKEHVAPEREHFGGFEKAKNEVEARDLGSFFCPACGEAINQEQRIKMVRNMRLIHKGQAIDKRGRVKGDRPKTFTLFFRWSAFQNLFVSNSELSVREWKAAQHEDETAEKENAERALCQQTWAKPFELKLIDAAPLDRKEIRKRTANYTIGVLPPDTQHLVFGVDVGMYTCWYFGIAFRSDGSLHCPIYGSVDTDISKSMDKKTKKQYVGSAIKSALHQIFDIIEGGFAMPGGQMKAGDLTLVDTRYQTKHVFDAVKQRGTGVKGPYLGIQGVGKSQLDSRRYVAPKKRAGVVRSLGDRYHVEYAQEHRARKVVIDVDDSKLAIQQCLRVTPGLPGSLTLAFAPQRDHQRVSNHLASEFYKVWKDKNGEVKEEFRQFGGNHLLDCAGYAWVGGKILKWKVPDKKTEPEPEKPSKPKKKKAKTGWLRGKKK